MPTHKKTRTIAATTRHSGSTMVKEKGGNVACTATAALDFIIIVYKYIILF
jgi:hypothetical protein